MSIEIWSYRDGVLENPSRVDLVGYSVEAVDGTIGTVHEATHDVAGSYIVVNTDSWLLGKKVMLPAGTIDRIDLDDETVYVGRSKETIENAPAPEERGVAPDSRLVGDYYNRWP